MRFTTRVCRAFVGMLLLSVVCGCADSGDNVVGPPCLTVIEREVNTDGHTVVIIPFKDDNYPYFESRNGSDLSERVAGQMRRHLSKTRFVSALPIRKKFDSAQIENMGVDELGKAVRADRVLVGNIREFTAQEPKTVGILRGTCRIDLVLFDAPKKQSIWRQSFKIHYPERGVGIPSTDTTPEKIREELLKLTSDTIAKKFYTYKERRKPPPMDMGW